MTPNQRSRFRRKVLNLTDPTLAQAFDALSHEAHSLTPADFDSWFIQLPAKLQAALLSHWRQHHRDRISP